MHLAKKIQRKRVNVTAMSSFSLCQHNILNVEMFMTDSVSDFWNSHTLFIAARECGPCFPLNFFLEGRKAKKEEGLLFSPCTEDVVHRN